MSEPQHDDGRGTETKLYLSRIFLKAPGSRKSMPLMRVLKLLGSWEMSVLKSKKNARG